MKSIFEVKVMIEYMRMCEEGVAQGWHERNGGKPTSEFPTHFMNHSVRKRVTNGENRIIYHAHTPNVIALTYVLPLTATAFTRLLWKSATECCVVFPGGGRRRALDGSGGS